MKLLFTLSCVSVFFAFASANKLEIEDALNTFSKHLTSPTMPFPLTLVASRLEDPSGFLAPNPSIYRMPTTPIALSTLIRDLVIISHQSPVDKYNADRILRQIRGDLKSYLPQNHLYMMISYYFDEVSAEQMNDLLILAAFASSDNPAHVENALALFRTSPAYPSITLLMALQDFGLLQDVMEVYLEKPSFFPTTDILQMITRENADSELVDSLEARYMEFTLSDLEDLIASKTGYRARIVSRFMPIIKCNGVEQVPSGDFSVEELFAMNLSDAALLDALVQKGELPPRAETIQLVASRFNNSPYCVTQSLLIPLLEATLQHNPLYYPDDETAGLIMAHFKGAELLAFKNFLQKLIHLRKH